ncbi:treslin-like isoform X1 [Ochotona curzoniae]|uniref:treslin-like isoform X1 n=1 Tax=Ochotona curzoniae TaxID=130825 RepID=UPI001B34CE23|nr:treslin-like isoform X1 [Ochotona curzoniae]
MACCHKVMLLLDTAGGAERPGRVRRAALRLLTYLSCRFGLARVHWAFKFFDSQGARSRPSRGRGFRELGVRSWQVFEEELEARLGERGRGGGAHLPGPAPRASHTHGALLEALLEDEWERPEITSPTKPVLRSSGRRLLDVEGEPRGAAGAAAAALLGGRGNAVFLLAPCPHSRRELLQFVGGSEAPGPRQLTDRLLPRRVQEVLIARKITLYWVDTTEGPELWKCPDHFGYWTVRELLHHGGGTVLLSETFSWDLPKAGEVLSKEPHLSPWISTLPAEATLNHLLYNSPEYEASFPRMKGTLFLPVEAGQESQATWTVTLEPLAMHQRHFQTPVRIFVQGSVAQWSLPASSTLGTDSWMLQSPEEHKSTPRLFQQLVSRLTAEELHLVVTVDPGEGWPPVTGVISPLSTSTTVLIVFRTEEAVFQSPSFPTAVAQGTHDTTSLFSDVVDDILNQVDHSLVDPAPSAPPAPEWALQELGRTTVWNPTIVENWFPFSNTSGASSTLMESFWLLQAASANKESSKTESELTRGLSEVYQRKRREESATANQDDRKKRGVPRTPVRQKMNAMCRSLKMVNVARLNVKAQKLHPDDSPEVPGDKGVPRVSGGKAADKLEDRGRTLRSSKPKDFKTEDELLTYIHENYQKTVATEESTLWSCARNIISIIKEFLKSKGTKDLEVNCLNLVKSNFLKTSKSLRQNVGKKLDKEAKVRECQLQVFLRLELCVQCPSICENLEDVEYMEEEVTDLLRLLYLTEDSAYLANFLEEILRLYIDSIPKTLGNLYNSLGFMIPQKLARVLPTDFFSDDSMTQEIQSPLRSLPLLPSAHPSVLGSTESDQLEELRTRSAKKRRKNALIRHKSIAEVSQNLRQIEIPKMSKRATKNENTCADPQQPPQTRKDTGQEVTKVRRNLFNQEMLSPSKRSLKRGLPRSHSVSVVDGLGDKVERKTKGYHKLLTKSVAETPVHKQISRRLLHRQIKGRASDPGPDIDVVEESPEKGEELNLRRSPRIKQLSFSRTNSGSFYSVSQPKSRSIQRVHSFQQGKADQRGNSPVQSIRSPKRLLFGAVSEVFRSSSEKSSARTRRSSGNVTGSEMPATYQTPKKRYQKSPSFAKTTPRRFPRTPQTPPCAPEGLQTPPAEKTPAKQAIAQKSPGESPQGCGPWRSRGAAPEAASCLEAQSPRTPVRPGTQPSCTWPYFMTSSPKSAPHPAPPTPSSTPPRSSYATPSRPSFRTPQRAAACVDSPQTPKHSPGSSHLGEAVQNSKDSTVGTPEGLSKAATDSSPPVTPQKQFHLPFRDGSQKSLFRKTTASPSPGEQDQKEPPAWPSSPGLLTPHRASQATASNTPAPQPSDTGRQCWKTSLQGDSLQGQPAVHTAPGVGMHSLASVTDLRRGQKEVRLCPQSPSTGQSSPGGGFGSGWPRSSSNTECLSLEEADRHGSDGLQSVASSGHEGEGLQTSAADERPHVLDPGAPPTLPSSGPCSLTSCYGLRCTADRRQRQAIAHEQQPQASAKHLEAAASPQAFEVELEMQASGLPKLRIKKMEPGSLLEAESLRKEESALGEESSGPSVPRTSRSSHKPESTYMSPPCLRPSHSTPGKGGGQTYICQSCTPTHCPSSTPSPFQTDVGVPWTPSPKHSGKTTPDTIKDWPRRKRAVDCSTGTSAGRSEVGAEIPGGLLLPEPEGKGRGVELSPHRTSILGDFELEGVCQLPDQSPPGDSMPKAEEAASWGQFGLGSRKRLLSAEEEVEYETKRVCAGSRGDSVLGQREERSPACSGRLLPSTGDDEVFVTGSTPPPCYTTRSCLSASGLQALTQSPLLFQGKTSSSQARDTRDEDSDVFLSTAKDSPSSQAFSRRRPIGRTYTRKKLIS